MWFEIPKIIGLKKASGRMNQHISPAKEGGELS
jgi:hypothetical protein